MKLRHLLLFMFFSVFASAQTVVDIIVNSEDHTTLEAAVIAAGLDGTLSGDGPFTVFAPTDDAFAALPEGTVEALLLKPTANLAPSARRDAAILAAGEVVLLDVLSNDSDPDGDALTLLAINTATYGKVEQVGTEQIRYTPPSDFHGLDTFTYVVSDGRGGSAVAEVAVTVEPPLDFAGAVELAPVAIE